MPSNKKPRKAYRPKAVSIGYNPAEIQRLKEVWQRVEFGAFISLQNASAVIDDLLCIRDMFNVCLISIVVRNDMDEETAKEAWNIIQNAGEATKDIIYRGLDANHFVAKGDEMRAINEAVCLCGDFVQESLDKCPGTFMQMWATAKALSKGDRPMARKTVSAALIKRTYYNMTPDKFRRISA